MSAHNNNARAAAPPIARLPTRSGIVIKFAPRPAQLVRTPPDFSPHHALVELMRVSAKHFAEHCGNGVHRRWHINGHDFDTKPPPAALSSLILDMDDEGDEDDDERNTA